MRDSRGDERQSENACLKGSQPMNAKESVGKMRPHHLPRWRNFHANYNPPTPNHPFLFYFRLNYNLCS